MIILFLTEFNSYLEVKTTSEMFIDVNRGGEKVFNYFKKSVEHKCRH